LSPAWTRSASGLPMAVIRTSDFVNERQLDKFIPSLPAGSLCGAVMIQFNLI
jgi:hypothetical protein